MNIEEKLTEKSNYNRTNDTRYLSLSDAISICKEAIKKAKIEENKRWNAIQISSFMIRIKELESEK